MCYLPALLSLFVYDVDHLGMSLCDITVSESSLDVTESAVVKICHFAGAVRS
jgi:hypothetical protein